MKKLLPILFVLSCFDNYKINYDTNGRTQYIEDKESKRYITYDLNSTDESIPSSSITTNLQDLLKEESVYNMQNSSYPPLKRVFFVQNKVTMYLSIILTMKNISIVELTDKNVDFMTGSQVNKESKYKITTYTSNNEIITLKNGTTNTLTVSFALTEEVEKQDGYFWIKVITKESGKEDVLNVLYLKYAVADEAGWKDILPHTVGYKLPLEVIYRSSDPDNIKEHSIDPEKEVRIVYNKDINSKDYNVIYNKDNELLSVREEAIKYDDYTTPTDVTDKMIRLATRPTTIVEVIKYLKDVA